ncbi:MAG: hypothetical protein M3P06_21760 [Acidobacteriota bacterium]|nr:hypothetical protein [Acidobacteriota bacterium]
MTDVLGFAAWLLLPLIGGVVWRLEGVRRLGLDGRLAIAGAAGALITAAVMTAMSVVGVEWSRTRLFLLLLPLVIIGVMHLRGGKLTKPSIPIIGILLILGITAYGLLTGRETCGDLLFFWGSKGMHFFRAGGIDLDYLGSPHHFFSHADYPPVLPLLFAWSTTLSRQFSWWSALLLSGLCLTGIIAFIRAGTRDYFSALLAAAVMTYAMTHAQTAGAADPLLLFFEAIAVGALLFIDDRRTQTVIAAIGVAGAVATKVEGASFLVAVLLAMLIDRRGVKRSIAVVLPAMLILGLWLWFVISNGLLDTYRGNGSFSLQYLGVVLRETLRLASYNAWWIPWIAPVVVVFLGDWRRALLPLSMAVLTLGATLFFYLKASGDPTFLIITSASRVLLTPLLMLVLAAAAAGGLTPRR